MEVSSFHATVWVLSTDLSPISSLQYPVSSGTFLKELLRTTSRGSLQHVGWRDAQYLHNLTHLVNLAGRRGRERRGRERKGGDDTVQEMATHTHTTYCHQPQDNPWFNMVMEGYQQVPYYMFSLQPHTK